MGDLDYVKCSVRNNGQRSTNIDDGNLLLRSLRANYIKRKRHRFLTILLLKDYGTFQYDNVTLYCLSQDARRRPIFRPNH